MVVVILQLLVVFFVHRSDDSTRGNQLKLYKCHCTVDVTKHYFANRIVNVWNSLPDTVVTAPSSLSFRRQLAKFNLSSFCVNFCFFSIYALLCYHCLLCSLFFFHVFYRC